jgi:hypothetical protein
MVQDAFSTQTIELAEQILAEPGVCFDPDSVTLQGSYSDEISAYRAKKLWAETLEMNFLLDEKHDFALSVSSNLDANQFLLNCKFLTACGRYAFWRITNNQAPEAQYVIETAHIPMCESRHNEILRAPDMRPLHDEPLVLGSALSDILLPHKNNLSGWLKDLIKRLSA